jgi:hypothetical protein
LRGIRLVKKDDYKEFHLVVSKESCWLEVFADAEITDVWDSIPVGWKYPSLSGSFRLALFAPNNSALVLDDMCTHEIIKIATLMHHLNPDIVVGISRLETTSEHRPLLSINKLTKDHLKGILDHIDGIGFSIFPPSHHFYTLDSNFGLLAVKCILLFPSGDGLFDLSLLLSPGTSRDDIESLQFYLQNQLFFATCVDLARCERGDPLFFKSSLKEPGIPLSWDGISKDDKLFSLFDLPKSNRLARLENGPHIFEIPSLNKTKGSCARLFALGYKFPYSALTKTILIYLVYRYMILCNYENILNLFWRFVIKSDGNSSMQLQMVSCYPIAMLDLSTAQALLERFGTFFVNAGITPTNFEIHQAQENRLQTTLMAGAGGNPESSFTQFKVLVGNGKKLVKRETVKAPITAPSKQEGTIEDKGMTFKDLPLDTNATYLTISVTPEKGILMFSANQTVLECFGQHSYILKAFLSPECLTIVTSSEIDFEQIRSLNETVRSSFEGPVSFDIQFKQE